MIGRPYSIETSGRAIGQAFSGWLNSEVQSSSNPQNRNRYLDEYEEAIVGLKSGWDHPKNYTAAKFRSHLDRLPFWFEAFATCPTTDSNYDYLSARVLFAALMQVSGSYRNQCYIEATDADDYLARRSSKPAGISLQHTATGELRRWLPPSGNFSKAKINLEELDEQRNRVSKLGEAAVRKLCSRAQMGWDLGQADSHSAQEMLTAQYNWTVFAVDCVILAAKIRNGNPQVVPFLEPKSISDEPEVEYPLRALLAV